MRFYFLPSEKRAFKRITPFAKSRTSEEDFFFANVCNLKFPAQICLQKVREIIY